jgi:hypothetical protein
MYRYVGFHLRFPFTYLGIFKYTVSVNEKAIRYLRKISKQTKNFNRHRIMGDKQESYLIKLKLWKEIICDN